MIPLFKVFMPAEVDGPLLATLHSGFIGQGVKVDKFEDRLAELLGVRHVLTLNSGTTALHLALKLAGVGPGDEVITTPMTCMATNTPIVAAGAKIVWADIDPETGNMDPASIPPLITARTRAVMCVHWGGYPCDMAEIMAAANAADIPVIADGAHAFGAQYRGESVARWATYTEFSFQAIKHLTTVDGGALVVHNDAAFRRGKLLRWYGIDRETPRSDFRCEDDVVETGFKWHMNDVAATIGLTQLDHTPQILDRHRQNAAYYTRELLGRGIQRVRPLAYKPDRSSAYWLYTVKVDGRDAFIEHMRKAGIQVSRVHARNDRHSCFGEFRRPLPHVDAFDAVQCSIPVGWWVTDEARAYIMAKIEEFDAHVLS